MSFRYSRGWPGLSLLNPSLGCLLSVTLQETRTKSSVTEVMDRAHCRLLPHHASFPGLTQRSSKLTSRELSKTCFRKLDAVCACSEGGPGRNWLWQMGGSSTLGTKNPASSRDGIFGNDKPGSLFNTFPRILGLRRRQFELDTAYHDCVTLVPTSDSHKLRSPYFEKPCIRTMIGRLCSMYVIFCKSTRREKSRINDSVPASPPPIRQRCRWCRWRWKPASAQRGPRGRRASRPPPRAAGSARPAGCTMEWMDGG